MGLTMPSRVTCATTGLDARAVWTAASPTIARTTRPAKNFRVSRWSTLQIRVQEGAAVKARTARCCRSTTLPGLKLAPMDDKKRRNAWHERCKAGAQGETHARSFRRLLDRRCVLFPHESERRGAFVTRSESVRPHRGK